VAAHQAGRLAQARASYEAVLGRAPDHFDALHMLGVAVVQCGEAAAGAELIERATRIAPDVAAAHVNLAMALSALGRHQAALESAERAAKLDRASPEAHTNRGNALLALGRPAEALAAYEQALAARPDHPQAHYNRANALRDLGRAADAVAAYDAALALAPGYTEALANRGALLVTLNRLVEALATFDTAVTAHPTADMHLSRGLVLAKLARLDDALASFDAALAADPQSAEAHSRRAAALNDLGRTAAALAAADRAIELDPDLADAHNSRGIALYDLQRLDEALASYDRAVALKPQGPEAHLNRALARLKSGDLAAGFAEYPWRWRVRDAARFRPAVAYPDWEGQGLEGRRLLIFSEQGFGDSLQFVRYAPRLAALGARVTLLVEAPLVGLFSASLAGVEVVDRLPDDAAYDFQLAMLCLPRLFRTTFETIPGDTPYLAADAAASAAWSRRLAALPGCKIGLVWAGASRRHSPMLAAIDARRSLSLAQLEPLAAIPDVQFISLQVGEAAAEVLSPPEGLRLIDWTSEIRDFADTAALVAGLDLVITVDTAVAHLAGALGRPVWILSRYEGCWRWLTGREDSPWYPTARLFRQAAPGAWDPVTAAVAAALGSFAGSGAIARVRPV
jgi:tetratricopeptide (TPR) repeat protein